MSKGVVLGFYTITPAHPGSGTELSIIDLPIQRERHTGFPVIWGQSIKGVLRRYFSEKYENLEDKRDEIVELLFGPPTNKAHEHAGTLLIGDAKILLFPVRSLKGVYAYVTSPLVLSRFIEDLELAGFSKDISIPEVDNSHAYASKKIILNGKIVLEDLAPNALEDNDVLTEITNLLGEVFGEELANRVKERLALVSNDVFRDFVELTTEIVARTRIDAGTGTVASGGLWYEEFLPSDTFLYSIVLVQEGLLEEIKKKKNLQNSTSEEAISLLRGLNGKIIQIGGDETVGKGFTRIYVGEVQRND